jgi:DEAD/DEAH box helicase domain-containing protein
VTVEDSNLNSVKEMLFFDLETQHSFQEVGGRNHLEKLLVSVAVTYSTLSGEFKSYTESQVLTLIEDLLSADTVVGFNLIHFDYRVLTPYTHRDLSLIKTIDMLLHLRERLGFRVSLDSLAHATLGTGKSADGLQAIRWFREGNMESLIAYCKNDVTVTRNLYEYGNRNGYVYYWDRYTGKRKKVSVRW